MSEKVVVLIESGTDRPQHITFSREEIEPWDELEALRRKSQAPCDRHEGGGCDCGKKEKEEEKIKETTPPQNRPKQNRHKR
jgi:hypothetical protein